MKANNLNSLTFNLPEKMQSILFAAGYTTERTINEAKLYLAAGLFSNKILSLEQAAELAEMALWDFIPFLGKQGINVVDYNLTEAEKELELVEWLAKK